MLFHQNTIFSDVRRRLSTGKQHELAEDFANDSNVEAGVLVIALETALRERGNKSAIKLTDQYRFKDTTPLANKQEVELMELIWRIGELRGAAAAAAANTLLGKVTSSSSTSSPSSSPSSPKIRKGKGGAKQQQPCSNESANVIANSFFEQFLRHLGIILVTRELRDFNKGERECLCRAFACISRAREELMRVRVICYESLLVMDKDDLVTLATEDGGSSGSGSGSSSGSKSGNCLRSLVYFMLNLGQVWPAVLVSKMTSSSSPSEEQEGNKDSTESIMLDTMRMILFRALRKIEDKQRSSTLETTISPSPYAEEVAILCKAVGWDAYVSGYGGDDSSLEALVLRFLELLKTHIGTCTFLRCHVIAHYWFIT